MAARDSRVEIGYLEKTDRWKLESRFFPSKVGGKPAWLDLKNIKIDLGCGRCSKPCIFLCQLYAPLTDGDTCHRTIYLFVCKDPDCFKRNDSTNFVAYRCQLPANNEYYPEGEPEDREDWCPQAKVCNYVKTCVVCGSYAGNQCGNCKTTKYCSRDHQLADWKSGHNKICGSSEEKSADFLFPEFEIICEDEIIDDDDDDAAAAAAAAGGSGEGEKLKKGEERPDEEKLKDFEDYVAKYKEGTLSNVDPKAIEELAFGKEDKYFKKFKQRLKICPDQVIRYDRGGEPLWISDPNSAADNIPNCEYCNSPRQFEFQVLATLLNYLNVDSLGKSIDWGVLLLYTCKKNCCDGPSYKKEFLIKQDVAE